MKPDTIRCAEPRVPLREIGFVFCYVGLLSVGGGLAAWLYREIVEKRRWVSDTQFFSGLALSQVMPGTNMVNLTIHLGYALRGPLGACVALLAFAVPPAILLTALYAVTLEFQNLPLIQFVLAGVAAAAVGLSLATGIKALHRSGRTASFVVVGSVVIASLVLKVPTLVIFVLTVPISILLAFRGYYD